MNKIYSGKKEGNSDTCYNMDDAWRHYAQWNKLVQNIVWVHLDEASKSSQIHRNRKVAWWFSGAGGKGEEELLFNKCRVSV